MILQPSGVDGHRDLSFTVSRQNIDTVLSLLESLKPELHFREVHVNEDVARVSIVGSGIMGTGRGAAAMFEALSEEKINILMIASGELKISVLVEASQADQAALAIHRRFFGSA